MANAGFLRGLTTVSFYADDVTAAKQWYSDLLGMAPYFERSAGESLVYIEFRLGDHQHELGIIDRRFAPKGAGGSGGAIVYWHVDDVAAAIKKLLTLGAKEFEPITQRGPGFTTASVIDPFGNILGIMFNQHFLDMQQSRN
jgi:predicted enzyme related to lactoylglutathione lyase